MLVEQNSRKKSWWLPMMSLFVIVLMHMDPLRVEEVLSVDYTIESSNSKENFEAFIRRLVLWLEIPFQIRFLWIKWRKFRTLRRVRVEEKVIQRIWSQSAFITDNLVSVREKISILNAGTWNSRRRT